MNDNIAQQTADRLAMIHTQLGELTTACVAISQQLAIIAQKK